MMTMRPWSILIQSLFQIRSHSLLILKDRRQITAHEGVIKDVGAMYLPNAKSYDDSNIDDEMPFSHSNGLSLLKTMYLITPIHRTP